MSKFFVLFEIPAATADEWRKTTSPEKMKAQSDELTAAWSKWMAQHRGAFVEMGAPLGRTKRVTATHVSDARNDLSYYAIIEADSHADAAALFADHPHLRIPDSYIEVLQIPNGAPM
jgi:hypothetical protein